MQNFVSNPWSPRAAAFLLVQALLLPAAAAPETAAKEPPISKAALAGEGPLLFRCDSSKLKSNPNRTVCIGNVVFRRGNILGCCERFEAELDEEWGARQAVCQGDVRALRDQELMWAERADYVTATAELVLVGKPLVRRGESVIEGTRVVAQVDEEQVQIEKPRGRFVMGEQPIELNFAKYLTGALPSRCPLPRAPRSARP